MLWNFKKNQNMKKNLFNVGLFFLVLTVFSGCDLIGGVYRLGVWSGIIMVVLLVVLVFYLINKINKRK